MNKWEECPTINDTFANTVAKGHNQKIQGPRQNEGQNRPVPNATQQHGTKEDERNVSRQNKRPRIGEESGNNAAKPKDAEQFPSLAWVGLHNKHKTSESEKWNQLILKKKAAAQQEVTQ